MTATADRNTQEEAGNGVRAERPTFRLAANPPFSQSYGRRVESVFQAESPGTFASPRMSRNKRLASDRPLGGAFTGLLRWGARRLAPLSCMGPRHLRFGTLSRPRDTQTSMAFPLFYERTYSEHCDEFKGLAQIIFANWSA